MTLLQLISRRLLQLIGVLAGISLVTFLLVHMAPGDPARLLAGERASAETIAAIRSQYGLDLPLWQQFLTYLANLASGDIGLSLRFQRPVSQLIEQFMWPTLFLTGYVLCLAIPPTVVLAFLGARRPGGIADQVVRLLGIAGLTIPVFWLGIMMSRFFGVSLGWFPVSGYGAGFTGHLHHLFLPALSTAIWLVPVLTQSLRAALIEKTTADFVTAARAQGATERQIFWQTMLPNAALPTLNLLGVMVAFMIGGAVIVETVYAVPGLGTLMVNALLGRDYYVVQGLTLIFAVSTVLITLMVDLLTAFIDPRVRF
ncbi:ABC transporter permease [Rhizobium lentis]|uniref:ABC transporter permease n=1 Tax=Rhizobium TaxID=379 RepID=UPI001105C164|nr:MULTISPECIES: ABC transporter permease [Rhizobium]MBX5002150.1 ABC transporter permease [Rhizobium lentis]MBX5020958.1 ABC transporter permease [Rhizobium lentis]MBX5087543.1 ABC transporter permease [Rhizobium lentis]MBX5100249.1 ABC transporter permease [Rhizobium lentis]MBX5124937.1 ABC transporter permease [Rhizobium lentis]